MSRYAVQFTKNGYLKYTSHLDMLRLFKRIIKRSDIKLKYSQGYNPHPKMGFAQPLSLGYESMCEYLEMETAVEMDCEDIKERLESRLPEGIRIPKVTKLPDEGKSLAATCYEAEYFIAIPVDETFKGRETELVEGYLSQKQILVPKKQKKSKEFKEVDIKDKIRSMNVIFVDNNYIMTLITDCGSDSNLSPELVITSFIKYAEIPAERAEIDVMRKRMTMAGYSL